MGQKTQRVPFSVRCFAAWALLTVLVGTPVAVNASSHGPQYLPVTASATLGNVKFDLEVAETPAQKTLGMRGRPKLPPNRGMLFVFDPPQPVAFWMKDTLHPLDLIFIADNRVQRVVRNAKPCAAEPCPFYGTVNRPMEYVLEVRAGTAKSLRLRTGDPISIDFYDGRSSIKKSDGGTAT